MSTIFENDFMHVDINDETKIMTFDRNATQHGSIVVPYTKEGKIILIREWRAGADEFIIGVVKGAADNMEESYIDVAKRELREELGVTSDRIVVSDVEPFALPPFTKTRGRFCTAYDCVFDQEQDLDDGEQIELYGIFTESEVKSMIIHGEINDAESIAALLYTMI